MATLSTSGTQAATLGTTHTLKTLTAVGTYQLLVDTNALANGETVRLQAKTRILSGGGDRVVQEAVYANSQGTNLKASLPIFSDQSITFTLLQTGSTGVSFPWKIVQLDASS
jgi:hypothetical protein